LGPIFLNFPISARKLFIGLRFQALDLILFLQKQILLLLYS